MDEPKRVQFSGDYRVLVGRIIFHIYFGICFFVLSILFAFSLSALFTLSAPVVNSRCICIGGAFGINNLTESKRTGEKEKTGVKFHRVTGHDKKKGSQSFKNTFHYAGMMS